MEPTYFQYAIFNISMLLGLAFVVVCALAAAAVFIMGVAQLIMTRSERDRWQEEVRHARRDSRASAPRPSPVPTDAYHRALNIIGRELLQSGQGAQAKVAFQGDQMTVGGNGDPEYHFTAVRDANGRVVSFAYRTSP